MNEEIAAIVAASKCYSCLTRDQLEQLMIAMLFQYLIDVQAGRPLTVDSTLFTVDSDTITADQTII